MQNSEPPLAVVFDMDGLMFNTEELYEAAAGQILAARELELHPELLQRMMGRPTPIALQLMIDYYQLEATPQQLQEETSVVFRSILDERLAPMSGLMPLLDALEQAAIPKAVATSSRREFADYVLNRFGMQPRFEFVLSGESVEHGKPEPDIYHLAAQRLTVANERMAVLEDSHNGCRAAVAAGAIAIAVPGPHSAKHDFSGARLVAHTLRDDRLWRLLGLQELDRPPHFSPD